MEANSGPVEPEEGFGRTVQQLLSIYVEPEVRRRQEAGKAEKPFALVGFQIVMFSDERPAQVRLNEEVKAIADVRLKPGIEKRLGEPIHLDEIEGTENITRPTDDEPDGAHATVIRMGEATWIFTFDFRYNKALAATHLDVASEFLATAQDALREGRTRVFADTLFSAVELVAKGDLLLLPLAGFTKKATHRRIGSQVNLFSVSGRVPEEFKDAFNELGTLRRDARYLDSPYSISDESAKRLLRTVQERLDEIRQQKN